MSELGTVRIRGKKRPAERYSDGEVWFPRTALDDMSLWQRAGKKTAATFKPKEEKK